MSQMLSIDTAFITFEFALLAMDNPFSTSPVEPGFSSVTLIHASCVVIAIVMMIDAMTELFEQHCRDLLSCVQLKPFGIDVDAFVPIGFRVDLRSVKAIDAGCIKDRDAEFQVRFVDCGE